MIVSLNNTTIDFIAHARNDADTHALTYARKHARKHTQTCTYSGNHESTPTLIHPMSTNKPCCFVSVRHRHK